MAIVCRRRSTPHPFAGRSAAEDGGGATFLPREEWAKPGKKVAPPPLRLRRSRRSRPTARPSHGEAVGRTPNSILRRNHGQSEGCCKGSGVPGEETAATGQKKEASFPRPPGAARQPPTRSSSTAPGADRPKRSNEGRIPEGQEHDLHRAASPTRRSGRRGGQRFWPCGRHSIGE